MSKEGTEEHRYYPVCLDLAEKLCLVVGGGTVAARKVGSLTECGARVRVVAPEVCPEIEAASGVEIARRPFQTDDLDGVFLVVSASDDHNLNATVAELARDHGILVNVVDKPDLCNFIVTAAVRRGALLISVSTSGVSPALAKRIRTELETQFGDDYSRFLDVLRDVRREVMESVPDPKRRAEILTELADPRFLGILQSKGPAEMKREMRQLYKTVER